jgi:hypothetical protein
MGMYVCMACSTHGRDEECIEDFGEKARSEYISRKT